MSRTGTLSAVFAILVLFATGCENSAFEIGQSSAGEILSAKPLQLYSQHAIRQTLAAHQLPDSFPVVYPVEVIAIWYQTTGAVGRSIQASGALLIPLNISAAPMMSIQHGTETRYDRVASVHPANSAEGIAGLLTASLGYVTCIPDYPGFGVSFVLHPYHHAPSLTPSVIDLLRAARTYCSLNGVPLDNRLFLTGYSEGGYVTLAVQKEIEERLSDEFDIEAVAPMGGVYDVVGTFDFLLSRTTYRTPAYLAFFWYAYDSIYGWNSVHRMFSAPYGSMLSSLFDGTKTFGEINGQLPATIHSLLRHDFIDGYLTGTEPGIRRALAENSLLAWTPVAPIHFFHGDADDVAPYRNAEIADSTFRSRGAPNVSLTTIPGGKHETAGVAAFLGALTWFEQIRNSSHTSVSTTLTAPSLPE